jgi:hypothetical protein
MTLGEFWLQCALVIVAVTVPGEWLAVQYRAMNAVSSSTMPTSLASTAALVSRAAQDALEKNRRRASR